MPGRLTTHVLDTAEGRPAAGLSIELFRLGPEGSREWLTLTHTNQDGRTDNPLLSGSDMKPGTYELIFDVGGYFAATGRVAAAIPFLSKVPVRFGVADPDAHYHVPLLASPWAYSTYRGS